MALSGGFNPQPKVAYGTALAFGLESVAEYVDLEFTRPMDPAEVARRVSREMPVGFELREVRRVPLVRPALQSHPAVAAYEARPEAGTRPPADLDQRIVGLLERESVATVRHKGRRVETRRYILAVEWCEGAGEPALRMELGSDNQGAGRPDEVLEALGLDPSGWRVLRTDFMPLVAGQRTSPWQC
jgi:radical SAM-linked protein